LRRIEEDNPGFFEDPLDRQVFPGAGEVEATMIYAKPDSGRNTGWLRPVRAI
jgi:hypothetical protein